MALLDTHGPGSNAMNAVSVVDQASAQSSTTSVSSRSELAPNTYGTHLIGSNGESLSNEVVAVLQGKILAGEFPVGSWIRQGAIAEELGISRTPVREALRILVARGLVAIEQHRGAQVVGLSSAEIHDVGVVRANLEGLAAGLAAERINDEQISRLKGSWDSFRAALGGSIEEQAIVWVKANDDFHSLILEVAGNKFLTIAVAELSRRLPHNLSFGAYAGNSRLIARNLQEHDAIADAIVAGDGETARNLMAAHIKDSNDATVRWVKSSSSAPR